VTVNAHYDHHRALAGNGTDIVESGPFAATNAELGRLIFSIGCHSGYGVPNFLYSSPFNLDWPETDFAAGAIARVANTTYGYGDTDVIGYSEGVEVEFAKRLRQASLGEALEFAKWQYIANLAAVGPYEQKAVNALTFYGLPMYHIGAGTTVNVPTPPTTFLDAATGLLSFPVVSNVTFGSPVATGHGSYFTGPDGVDATNNRPFEPKKIVPDITVPGQIPHGFLITGLGIDPPQAHFNAARSRAIPDSANLTPPLSSDVGWPSSISRISSFLSPTGPRQQLVLIHGQFLSDTDNDTTGTGTQTNFNQIAGKVLYSTSKDALPPQLANIRVTKVATGVAFEVDATDATGAGPSAPAGTIKELLVVYFEPGASSAHVAVLSKTPNTNHWSGGGPLNGSVDSINYFMQAVDAAGNVGLSVHKVIAAPIVLQNSGQGNVTITPSGTSAGNGIFSGPVTVSITADPGYALTYSVDGSAPAKFTAPFAVQGEGVHVVDAFADSATGDHVQATSAFTIDTSAPTITITTPQNGAVFLVGDTFFAGYFCNDGGVGLAPPPDGCAGPIPNGAKIDTSTQGTFPFTVRSKDLLGKTSSVTNTYQVWQFTGFSAPVNNPPVINTANAGQAIPVKFSLGGNRGLTPFAPGYPASQTVACDTGAPVDPVETTVTAGSSSLQYDAGSNSYTYVWKTDKAWAGTCRDLILQFPNGGSVRSAHFKFK
jgi:hypothetical protein